MKTPFQGRDILSILDFSKKEILQVLETAEALKKKPKPDLLKGKILASCFFEPSTRTRLSFESAMLRLGGQCLGFSDSSSTSSQKGESLTDSIKVIGSYADVIVIRHPMEGSARLAAEYTTTPVINAGDGANQHPTQTLTDLLAIKQCQKTIDNLHVAIVGDLKYGRTAHSLAQALSYFKARLYFICPEYLSLPEEILEHLKRNGIKFSFHRKISDVLSKCDILYLTRLQKERLLPFEQEFTEGLETLTLPLLKEAKKNLKIFHPLPRREELDSSLDSSPHAYYFEQAEWGVYARQALLALILGKL